MGIARREARQRKLDRIARAGKVTAKSADGFTEHTHSYLPTTLDLGTYYQISSKPSHFTAYSKFMKASESYSSRNVSIFLLECFVYLLNASQLFPSLHHHLLSRIRGEDSNLRYPDHMLSRVCIVGERVNVHKIIRINYTTYDFQRDFDSVNPRTNADVIIGSLTNETGYPYLYGRIRSIFHVMVLDMQDRTCPVGGRRHDVALVRWFRANLAQPSGIEHKRLIPLEFVPTDEEDVEPFGFINPEDIIRGVHILNAPAHGKSGEDYKRYYVGMRVILFTFLSFVLII